jgi:hypothetical protein
MYRPTLELYAFTECFVTIGSALTARDVNVIIEVWIIYRYLF